MNPRLAIVTGANAGIGKETVIGLLKEGYKVILGCRNIDKANAVKEELDKQFPNESSEVRELNLCDTSSVRRFCENFASLYESLDLLVNNAGILSGDLENKQDRLELMFATNHLGHHLLTMLLLDRLKKSKQARVINVSSRAHSRGVSSLSSILEKTDLNLEPVELRKKLNEELESDYGMWRNYSISKYANILFTCRLKKFLDKNMIENILTFSLHPGVIKTNLFNHYENKFWFYFIKPIISLFLTDSAEGAKTTLHCCLAKELENYNGWYFVKCLPTINFLDDKKVRKDAKKLWELSEKLVSD